MQQYMSLPSSDIMLAYELESGLRAKEKLSQAYESASKVANHGKDAIGFTWSKMVVPGTRAIGKGISALSKAVGNIIDTEIEMRVNAEEYRTLQSQFETANNSQEYTNSSQNQATQAEPEAQAVAQEQSDSQTGTQSASNVNYSRSRRAGIYTRRVGSGLLKMAGIVRDGVSELVDKRIQKEMAAKKYQRILKERANFATVGINLSPGDVYSVLYGNRQRQAQEATQTADQATETASQPNVRNGHEVIETVIDSEGNHSVPEPA